MNKKPKIIKKYKNLVRCNLFDNCHLSCSCKLKHIKSPKCGTKCSFNNRAKCII
jgi:hypothetical protein